MAELGSDEDSHSDETIVEGSVTDSDVDEEELQRRLRLPSLDTDIALTAQIRIDGGSRSPEIYFIHKFHEPTCSQKEEQIHQEACTSDQSQSLLQGWINCPSATENISKPDFSLNAAVEEQQNNSVGIELNGVQKDSEEKPVGNQQREKEVISDYCGVASDEEQTGERSSHPAEAAACAKTAQTTSRNATQLRETPLKCRDVSSHHQISEDTQQGTSHSDKAKNFEKIQKSTSKDKNDLEINIYGEMTQNVDGKERRRSKRIENKQNQEAFRRNFVNTVFPISLSTLNRRNMYGETILHRAVAQQNTDFVRNIIKSGGNVNARDYAGWTALHAASVEGFYEIANELLKAGADVNAKGNEQITPLQDAVNEGHYEMAELLLWYGADPLLKNEMGRCALEEASDPSMRKLLESYVATYRRHSISGGNDSKNMLNIQSDKDTNLHQIDLQTDASELPCANVIDSSSMDIPHQTVVNEVQNINTDISEDGTSCTEQMLQANAETHEVVATTNGIVENVQKENSRKTDEGVFVGVSGTECTEKNGDRNAETNVLSQFTETEVQTKKVGLDLQKTSQQAASYSSGSKTKLSCDQTQFSLPSEQQTSKKSDSFQSTRKEAVILHGTYNTRYGKKITRKRNASGETQLHIAARRGDLPMVKALISSGICVNDQDYAGWTAIHEACSRGFTEVISELLKAGADVNSRSLDGILPIHDAVCGNYLEVVKILLQHGANPCEKDGSGKSALDQACSDQMKELLKSYSSTGSVLPVETTEITERRYSLRSRTVKHGGCSVYKNDALELQHEKYSVSVAAIRDAEKKQKELLLFELRTSKDADLYIRRLSQTQNTLNKMLAKQKTERDALAKKYRASVESFKKGELRKQLVKLASRQKSLLAVVQKQEELVQKIQNYRKTKQVFSASCSEKQISISHGNDKRQNLTADAMMCPDVVTFNMELGASMPNGNHLEAHHSSENQECSQDPHVCFDETAANKDAIRCKEASDHSLAFKSRVREDLFSMSRLTNAVNVVTLPSEPVVSTTKTKCSQQKDSDSVACVATAKQGNRSLNPTSVTNTLNTMEARSSVVNVCQPGNNCPQVLADEHLHRHVHKEAAAIINSNKQQQEQQVILLTPTKNIPNTLQQTISWCNDNSFNANSVLTNLTSNTDYPVIETSSQGYSDHRYVQNQVRRGRRNKKKLQLIDLLELGRIKPGENVLEFKLQEFSHKATLLKNGKIRTSRRQILQNPVQWVKDLLGSDIYVSWQYAWNKVTYLGTQLSKFCAEEVAVSSDWELPLQERESLGKNFITRHSSNYSHQHQSLGTVSITHRPGSFVLRDMQPKTSFLPQRGVKTLLCTDTEAAVTTELKRSSVLFMSVEGLTHFLQFHEIVMVCKEEFLPCPIMEKHWSFYKECEDFGF